MTALLAARLREGTRSLHRQAERSGAVRALIEGVLPKAGYALLLRNLHPVYCALEGAAEGLPKNSPVVRFVPSVLHRRQAIVRDLAAILGTDWADRLAVLPEAVSYADRVTEAARGTGLPLIAHAYVRYLGDLSGGQLIRGRLQSSLALSPAELSAVEFPGIRDVHLFRSEFRAALDALRVTPAEAEDIVQEAQDSFRLNIALSDAVWRLGSCERAV